MITIVRTRFGLLVGWLSACPVALLARLHVVPAEARRTSRRMFTRNTTLGAAALVGLALLALTVGVRFAQTAAQEPGATPTPGHMAMMGTATPAGGAPPTEQRDQLMAQMMEQCVAMMGMMMGMMDGGDMAGMMGTPKAGMAGMERMMAMMAMMMEMMGGQGMPGMQTPAATPGP